MADGTSAQVRAAVQLLRPSDREVIVLFYLQGLPVKEIGKLLALSPAAIAKR